MLTTAPAPSAYSPATGAEVHAILDRAVRGERLRDEDALTLFHHAELPDLSAAAHAVRMRLNPTRVVSYIIDRNVNYTNVCLADCSFCAFYRKKGAADAYVLTHEELGQKVRETQALGGNQLLLQGGMHPSLKIEWYEEMLRYLKGEHGIHVHGFSAPEIHAFSKINKMTHSDVLARLKAAGMDSLPGGGAEILVDRVRKELTRGKVLTEDWLAVHRAWHQLGGRSTATMMFGHVETIEERIETFRRFRELQDETGGFTAFIDWTWQPENTELSRRRPDLREVGSWDYLRTTAIARLYIDNIQHIQSSWVTQGGRIGQVSLYYGCDDMGSIMIEENVVRAAGANFRLDEENLRAMVREAGFVPRRRNFFYDLLPEPESLS